MCEHGLKTWIDSGSGPLADYASGQSAPELPAPARLCSPGQAEFLTVLTAMLLQVHLKEVLR